MAAADSKPIFEAPVIAENPLGWGPFGVPEQFKDIPYQPFSKSERLGKAADDFSTTSYHGKSTRFQSHFAVSDDYGYYHADEDSSFQLVDFAKQQKSGGYRSRRWQKRPTHDDNAAGLQALGKHHKRDRERLRQTQKREKRYYSRRRWRDRAQIKPRDASVNVKSTWVVEEEIDFGQLAKLALSPSKPEDLVTCGQMEYYDRNYDKVNARNPRQLVHMEGRFHKVTTSDDPVIAKMAKAKQATVFATDAILAAIMTCSRSVYSWDLVVDKIDGNIFFDKRDDSDFDYYTVNETAFEPPQEEGEHINAPYPLSVEATYINKTFSRQCLTKSRFERFEKPNPFQEPGEQTASIGYRYRRWSLGDDVTLIARCEHDAVYDDKTGGTSYMTIRALNEFDPKKTGIDWRAKLESQGGAVLATELKNNSCKVARWTMQALLSGSSRMLLGFVSRKNWQDARSHVILGQTSFAPKDLAIQINLNVTNSWAILRAIIDIFQKKPDGKYVILKDAMKGVLRIFSVPSDTFEQEEEEEEEEEEQQLDDDDDDFLD